MERYIARADFDKEIARDPEFKTEKIILDNEAYAICDLIATLISKIEHTRRSLVK